MMPCRSLAISDFISVFIRAWLRNCQISRPAMVASSGVTPTAQCLTPRRRRVRSSRSLRTLASSASLLVLADEKHAYRIGDGADKLLATHAVAPALVHVCQSGSSHR